LFTAGRVRLLDHPRLFNELISLERRTQRSGHDTVDHPRGPHDDMANSVCACLVVLAGDKPALVISDEFLARSAIPNYWRRYNTNPGIRPVGDNDNSHLIARYRAGF
jgi:hypothetical protein